MNLPQDYLAWLDLITNQKENSLNKKEQNLSHHTICIMERCYTFLLSMVIGTEKITPFYCVNVKKGDAFNKTNHECKIMNNAEHKDY